MISGDTLGALFLVWYLGTKYQIDAYIRFKNVPTPYAVLVAAREVVPTADFLTHIWKSLGRILAGFAVATLVAVPLGMLGAIFLVMIDPFLTYLKDDMPGIIAGPFLLNQGLAGRS